MRGGFLADLGWEAAVESLSPAPRVWSRWPECSRSLGGGRSRGNSTSAGANLLLQEFPEKFPLGLICQRIHELSFTSCESSYSNVLKTGQGRVCRWSWARGRGWKGALADPCTPRGTVKVSVRGASAGRAGGASLLQSKNPQNLTWFSHWATVFPK